MAMSVAMFGAALPMKNLDEFKQVDGTDGSQKPLMGLQVKIAPSRHAIAHAQQTAAINRAAIAKPLPGNTEV